MVDTRPPILSSPPAPIQPQDVKARILTMATRLFGERGYEATSIQAIAEAAGVRKQSLLYHYPSKELLHHAVIEAWLLHWRDDLPKLMAQSSGYDRFSATVTALLVFFREDPNRARLALREMLDRPDALQRQMNEHLSPWIKLLADFIRMGQASGLLRSQVNPDAYVVRVLLMVMTSVAVGNVASSLVGMQQETDVNELVRMARDALFVAPPVQTLKG
jgi:AcrR family transcriptional regulator